MPFRGAGNALSVAEARRVREISIDDMKASSVALPIVIEIAA